MLVQSLIKSIHSAREIILSVFGGGTATLGWLIVANQYLQALAFIVSIIAGILAIRSHLKRRSAEAEVKK